MMRVEWDDSEPFTKEEEVLIRKLRRALDPVGFRCAGKTSQNNIFLYDISAIIVPKTRTRPLSVNLKATNRKAMGQALIGPEKALDDNLFSGNEPTDAYVREMGQAVNEFKDAISTM